jgi:hypothetical protein
MARMTGGETLRARLGLDLLPLGLGHVLTGKDDGFSIEIRIETLLLKI